MALVTISGYPCSGKTTRAKQLKELLEARQSLPVVLLNDDTQNLSREVYDAAATEKPARASLFSAVTRNLSPDRIVICDSGNYIKGYRYQLYCAARENKCRTVTIQVAAPAEKCKEWNEARQSNTYTPSTLDNLISRYEEPSPFARWDSPLFTIPWSDEGLPADDICDAITKGELRPPTQATVAAATGTTDYLQTLESTASSVISAVLAAQSTLPGGGHTTLSVPLVGATASSTTVSLTLPHRPLTMPQLQRMKRQFVTLKKQAASRSEMRAEVLAELFTKYIEDST